MSLDTIYKDKYLIRRKFFKLFGDSFHIYDENNELAFFSKLKAFKLREDIRLYTDKTMKTEVLRIHATKALDISSVYEVFDSATDEKIGALKRKGIKSIVKDEWLILDPANQEIGIIKEDSLALALIRRLIPIEFLSLLLPQKYSGSIGENEVVAFRHKFNPIVLKLEVDFSEDLQGLLDKRVGLAAAVLLSAIEGRQA